MSIEEHTQLGHPVLYIRQRIRGVSRRIRLGTGPEAVTFARQHLAERDAARREQSERAHFQVLDRNFNTACRQSVLIADAALMANGYYRHAGRWRKRRMQEPTENSLNSISMNHPSDNPLNSASLNQQTGAAKLTPEPELSAAELAENSFRYAKTLDRQSREEERQAILRLRELVGRVDVPYPQPHDIQALRAFLTERPWLWKIAGDPARQAAARLLRAAKLPPAAREVAKAAVIDILNSVYNPMASPIEQLLAEQVALRWLHLTIIEHQYSEALAKDEGSVSNALYWERRLTEAHRRYSRALRSLHSVQPPSNRKPVQYQYDWTKPDDLHTQDRFTRFDFRRFYENSWPNIFPDDEPSP